MWITRKTWERLESRLIELEWAVKEQGGVAVKLETPRETYNPMHGRLVRHYESLPIRDVVAALAVKAKLVALPPEAAKPARVK